MKDKKSNDIWVFVEIKEDGSVQPSSLELLNPGMQIAEKTKGKLVAVLFGQRAAICSERNSGIWSRPNSDGARQRI